MIGTTVTHKSLQRKMRFMSTKDSGNAGFSPFSIAGCKLWLDATKITSVTDGTAISPWTDSSGNGNDASNATTSARPVYKTAIKNGLPIVRFDGSDDELRGAMPQTSGTYTMFAVASMRAQSGNIGMLFQGANATSAYPYMYREVATGAMRLGSGGAEMNGAVPTLNTFYVFSFLWNAASSMVVLNGAVTNGSIGTTNTMDATYVLSRWTSGGPQWHQWDIGEILWYNSALSTTDRRAVEAYLGAKWAITVV